MMVSDAFYGQTPAGTPFLATNVRHHPLPKSSAQGLLTLRIFLYLDSTRKRAVLAYGNRWLSVLQTFAVLPAVVLLVSLLLLFVTPPAASSVKKKCHTNEISVEFDHVRFCRYPGGFGLHLCCSFSASCF